MPSQHLVPVGLQPSHIRLPPAIASVLTRQLQELEYLHDLAGELATLNARAAETVAEETAAAIERVHEVMATNPPWNDVEEAVYLNLIDEVVINNRAVLRRLGELANQRLEGAALPKLEAPRSVWKGRQLRHLDIQPWWRK